MHVPAVLSGEHVIVSPIDLGVAVEPTRPRSSYFPVIDDLTTMSRQNIAFSFHHANALNQHVVGERERRDPNGGKHFIGRL